MGVEVATLANQIHLCRVVGTSSSASERMSSNVFLLTVGGLPRLGTQPVPATLTVFTVPDSISMTSHLSWPESLGVKPEEILGEAFQVKILKLPDASPTEH